MGQIDRSRGRASRVSEKEALRSAEFDSGQDPEKSMNSSRVLQFLAAAVKAEAATS